MHQSTHYFHSRTPDAAMQLCDILSSYLRMQTPTPHALVLLCIGTDRVTGDSLGPLIGYKLSKKQLPNLYVYGTLEQPVHALNLEKILQEIKKRHPTLPVIAVDASFGHASVLDCVTVSSGSLKPGMGVDKQLCEAGDISITGIVSENNGDGMLGLETTRLNTVMQLADVISDGITEAAATLNI